MKTRFLGALALVLATLSASPAQAGLIYDLIGEQKLGHTTIIPGLNILEVEAYNGVVHMVGNIDGKPGRQLVQLNGSTATVLAPQVFNSLQSQTNPTLGDPRGLIVGAGVVNGSLLYYGDSNSYDAQQFPNAQAVEGTTWNPHSGAASGVGFVNGDISSFIHAASTNGVLVGNNAGTASATLNGVSVYLPGMQGGEVSSAQAISADGSLILGTKSGVPFFWRANDINALEYTLVDDLLAPLPGGSFGSYQGRIFADPLLGEVGLFQNLNLNFENEVVAYNLLDGSIIGTYSGELADAKIFNNELVLAVNGSTGGYFSTLSDPSAFLISDLLGPDHGYDRIDFARGGLYEGSLGFVATGSNGNGSALFTTSYELQAAAVPEPSSIMLFATATLMLAVFRRRLGLVQ